jgi:hypothetical protein
VMRSNSERCSSDPRYLGVASRVIASKPDCGAIDLQAERPKNHGVSRLVISSANAVWVRHLEPYGGRETLTNRFPEIQ